MRYALLVACLVVSSCAVRMNGQTQTRSLEIRPRTTAIDLSLFQITDDQGLNPRITAGFGTASFGEIQIHTGPTASPRTAFLSATSLAATTLIADSQNGARGQIQIDSDTGSPLVILPAAGMAGAIAWQLPGTNIAGALNNDGAGNLFWSPGSGVFDCTTPNNCFNLTDVQTAGGNKVFTGAITIQNNAFMRTLTIDHPSGQEQIDVLSNSAIHEVRIRSNRNTTGDAITITSGTSTASKVVIGTITAGVNGSMTLFGSTNDVSIRGGTTDAGLYIGSTQRITPTEFRSSDNSLGITNPACNAPFGVKDGLIVSCSP